MSEQTHDAAFVKLPAELAEACGYCTRNRQLAKQAQHLMDQVHGNRRVFVIPPVLCGHCFEGFVLTAAGKQVALLFAEHVRLLERIAAEEAARAEREKNLPY
jgi:hypothetical protein